MQHAKPWQERHRLALGTEFATRSLLRTTHKAPAQRGRVLPLICGQPLRKRSHSTFPEARYPLLRARVR